MRNSIARVGLIGGISWGATAEYYRRINLAVKAELGGHHSADMLIRSLDLHPLLEHADDVPLLEEVFAREGRMLHDGGASVLAVASFTGHRYSRHLKRLPLPFVDLVDAVASSLRTGNYRCVAVWATSYALGDAALLEQLGTKSGTRLITPPESARAAIDRIIFNELADQSVSETSMRTLSNLLARQTAAGAEALLLATTDFSPVAPLLDTQLPLLDATGIHCAAIIEAALAQDAGGQVENPFCRPR